MAALVALGLAAGLAPDRIAGRYLVIVATESSEAAARAHLSKLPPGAVVVPTDDYSGLKPHLYAVVDSAHDEPGAAATRCAELQKQSGQCYVRRAGTPRAPGEPNTSKAPDLTAAKGRALRAVPAPGAVEFAGQIGADARSRTVVAVSYALPKSGHRYSPVQRDYDMAVFLFAGDEPGKVEKHDLLKPGDHVWEDIQCGPLRLYRLGVAPATPAAIAQNCNEEGTSQFRFVLFADDAARSPLSGIASWSLSVYPDAPHERFVPNDDARVPGGLSSKRGDGKTVVDGVEGKAEAGSFKVRDFFIEYSDGKLVRRVGPWRAAEPE